MRRTDAEGRCGTSWAQTIAAQPCQTAEGIHPAELLKNHYCHGEWSDTSYERETQRNTLTAVAVWRTDCDKICANGNNIERPVSNLIDRTNKRK